MAASRRRCAAGRARAPAIYSSKDYPKLAKRRTELEALLTLFEEYSSLAKQKAEAEEA